MSEVSTACGSRVEEPDRAAPSPAGTRGPGPGGRGARWMLRGGSALLIVHGLLEVLPVLMLLSPNVPAPHFSFEGVADAWPATAIVGVVLGLLRLAAAGGILANRLWGWVLGVLLSTVTFAMLTLYLPFGVADAVLAGGALLMLIVARYGNLRILQ
jgi:hypothetical protein